MLDWIYFNSFLLLSTSFSTEELDKVFPKHTSRLLVQCTSAMLGGFTTTIITNPLDVCRARLQVPFKHLTRQYELFICLDYNELVFLSKQVQRLPSFPKTFSILWQEEGYRFITKGLSARMFQSGVFSVFIILGYESIKRLSLNEDYQDQIRW